VVLSYLLVWWSTGERKSEMDDGCDERGERKSKRSVARGHGWMYRKRVAAHSSKADLTSGSYIAHNCTTNRDQFNVKII
jgi:hypothetical protein